MVTLFSVWLLLLLKKGKEEEKETRWKNDEKQAYSYFKIIFGKEKADKQTLQLLLLYYK